jgi:hypothetical protein
MSGLIRHFQPIRSVPAVFDMPSPRRTTHYRPSPAATSRALPRRGKPSLVRQAESGLTPPRLLRQALPRPSLPQSDYPSRSRIAPTRTRLSKPVSCPIPSSHVRHTVTLHVPARRPYPRRRSIDIDRCLYNKVGVVRPREGGAGRRSGWWCAGSRHPSPSACPESGSCAQKR